MPYRLKDRNRQVPSGLKFYIAETKFNPFPFSSFKTIVDAVIQHRRVNPFLTKKHNWSLDYDEVSREVDAYNAAICVAHGWMDYVVETGGAVLPKATARPQPSRSVRNAAGGGKLLLDWLGDEGKPVSAELAEQRAVTCTDCPQNGKGDWTALFTKPASELIRRQLSLKHDLTLATPWDDLLGVCMACSCPLKLKVWAPMDHIERRMPEDVKALLDKRCWVLSEATK